MLSAISSCQDLDPFKFSRGVYFILEHSAELPRAEFEEIHDELRDALAAVAEYFGRPDAAALADRLTWALAGWYAFWRLSDACVELAKVDNSLFTPAIVDTLEQFSSRCPDTHEFQSERDDIQNSMKTLREVTGLPTHPEAVPAANSQSSSVADS